MNSQGPTRQSALPPRFKELMQGCRQMVGSHLSPLFLTLLENADVALLEFAGKAESNAAQSEFFAAMKDLKRKHAELEQTFFKSVERGFRDFISGNSNASPVAVGLGEHTLATLSLVAKQDVEAALPVQNMIAKAHANYSDQLYGLGQRLAVLNGGARLPEDMLPGAPEALAEAARNAFELLDMDAKTRMVMYAVFDRYVMRELSAMYDEYNRRLVNAGILPNLKYKINKHPVTSRPAAQSAARASNETVPAAEQGAGSQTIGDEAFQSILELMARKRGSVATPTAGNVTAATGETVSVGIATQSRTTILGTIDTIQHEYGETEASTRFHNEIIENIGVDSQLLEKLRTALVEERQRLYGGVDRRRVASADADVIDLVGMLFEYMLQDEQLPNVVKALLSRLHTPFLKVAIIDRQLFTEKTHPGRRLLDMMAEAGAKWVTEDNLERGIFPCMRAVVERVLHDFNDDLALFDELLNEFSKHLHDVEHKSQVIEQRSVAAADGQARLQNARDQANGEIDACLSRAQLAAEAQAFLRQVWAEKLTFIMLRERDGLDSAAWILAAKLAWDLTWSMAQHAEQSERDLVHDALPRLRGELRAGLENLQAYGRHDNERMFMQICTWQDLALTYSTSHHEPVPRVAVAPVRPAAIEPLSDEMRDMIERLGSLAFDTVFEFSATEESPARRLRLAWFSKISSNYMFVDAMGVKAAEYSRTNLARSLCTGQARMLTRQYKSFIDRALDNILSWLGSGHPGSMR